MLELTVLDPTGKFMPYFGNHHKNLPDTRVIRGGAVSFRRHFGKPLSEALWEDVTERLCAHRILVYRYSDSQWCLGWGCNTCIINLNENGTVDDIRWFPPHPQGNFNGVSEKLGPVVGNSEALDRIKFD